MLDQIFVVMKQVSDNWETIAAFIVALIFICKYVQAHGAVKLMVAATEIGDKNTQRDDGNNAKAVKIMIAKFRNTMIDGLVKKMYPHDTLPINTNPLGPTTFQPDPPGSTPNAHN